MAWAESLCTKLRVSRTEVELKFRIDVVDSLTGTLPSNVGCLRWSLYTPSIVSGCKLCLLNEIKYIKVIYVTIIAMQLESVLSS